MFRDLGFWVASADDIAKEVRNLPEVQAEITQLLGVDARDAAAIRDVLTTDSEKRTALNLLMHGRVLDSMEASGAEIMEVPLLFETAIQCLFSRVICVSCSRESQLERLTKRVGDSDLAAKWVGVQLPMRVKELLSDETIRTDLPLSVVRTDVARISNLIAR